MHANHPEMAARWEQDTPRDSVLPEHVGEKPMKPHMKPKSDPRMDAITDLHKMLSGAIASHLKAKKTPGVPVDAEEADEPGNDMSTPDSMQEEASENQLAAKNKKRFGPGHKK